MQFFVKFTRTKLSVSVTELLLWGMVKKKKYM